MIVILNEYFMKETSYLGSMAIIFITRVIKIADMGQVQ